MEWFRVDKAGLGRLLARKGPEFVLYELVQNAWDEQSSEVRVTLERVPSSRYVKLVVEDDNPDGFHDLSHAFTLFADSAKKHNVEKRGRFNLGEKLVLALCDEATISSTTGTVTFDHQGRHTKRTKRERGSCFSGLIKMTSADLERCHEAAMRLLPPPEIKTYYNGDLLEPRAPQTTMTAALPTEVADAEGLLHRTQRQTNVDVIEPLPGEVPTLYEMGIPVVETGDRWHFNVGQKVPLSMDRDNVPPSYLAKLRAMAVEQLHLDLTTEDANSAWVREAVQRHGDLMTDDTVQHLVGLRFGDKVVAYDPSDQEANSLAASKGYVVVHGPQMSKAEWDVAKRAGAILPAGQVTPSPKPFSQDGKPLRLLAQKKWTDNIRAVVAYVQQLAQKLLGCHVEVKIANDLGWPFAAAYGKGHLTINLGRVGHKWFRGSVAEINELLIHEFGHHYSNDHLSSEYHDALSRLGGQLSELALRKPELFQILENRKGDTQCQ